MCLFLVETLFHLFQFLDTPGQFQCFNRKRGAGWILRIVPLPVVSEFHLINSNMGFGEDMFLDPLIFLARFGPAVFFFSRAG